MKSIALSALLSASALASPFQSPQEQVCEQKIVYEYVYEQMPPPSQAPKPVVLSPAVPPNINPYSLQHVTPNPPKSGQSTSLYFQTPKSGSQGVGYSAVANVEFNAPSVVIDHCGYAKTSYSNGQLVIRFSYSGAYNAAKNQWGGLDKLYVMTYTPGCGNYEKGEHCFFSATKFAYDESTKTITCSGEAKDVTECVDGYQVDFGHGNKGGYYGNGNGNGTTPYNGTTPIGNGNDTYTANITALCNAPVDTKYHLPTACLGPYFDGDIDDIIGYENGTEASWASKVPSFIEDIDGDDLLDDPNSLKKRAFGAVGAWVEKKVVNPAVNKAKQIGSDVKNTVQNKIIPAIQNIGTFNLGTRSFAFKVPSSQKVDKNAPWPNARLLYKGIPNEVSKQKKIGTVKGKEVKAGAAVETALNIYCVDCGVQGNIKVGGSVKVGAGLIEYIVLDTEMDMTVSMFAGLSGNISATLPGFSADIVSTPITPFTIPPFIDLGPSLSVGIDMNVKIGLENAKVLAGGTLTWKGTKSRMAYKNGQSYGSNWTPEFKPSFNASGELSLGLDFGLPVELLLGVKLASSKKLGAGFAVEARPAIEAKASIEGSISAAPGSVKKTIGDEECPFIKTGIDLKFESGLSFKIGEQAKFPIVKFHKPLTKTIHKGCLTRTDAGFNFTTLPITRRELFGRQANLTNTTTTGNDTLWYLDTTQLTNETALELASDPVEDFNLPKIANTAYNDTDGVQYVSLYDSSEDFLLTSCGDGNLYMQLNEDLTALDSKGCGTLFAYDNTTDSIYGDGSGQLIYFYPEEMNAVGVSRLRHSSIENVPNKVEYIYFVPYAPEDDSSDGALATTEPIYVATTAAGDVYGTAVCLFSDETMPPKIFLIADLDAGLAMLKSPDVKYSITGGDVTDCFYLPLTQGNDTPASAWNGIADNLDWEEDWVEGWELDDKFLDDDEFEFTDEEIDEFTDSL